MHEWTDIEASRLRREDLLREAERIRSANEARGRGRRDASIASTIRWELARGFGLAWKLRRRPSPRG